MPSVMPVGKHTLYEKDETHMPERYEENYRWMKPTTTCIPSS